MPLPEKSRRMPKLVRAQAFAKAIEVQDSPSTIESINLKNMSVDESYEGIPLKLLLAMKKIPTRKGKVKSWMNPCPHQS